MISEGRPERFTSEPHNCHPSPKSFAFLTCAGFWPLLWLLCVSSACPSHSSLLSLASSLFRSKASNSPLASCKPLPLLSLLTPFPQVTPNPQETQQGSFPQKTPPFRRGVLITTVQKENLLKAKNKKTLLHLRSSENRLGKTEICVQQVDWDVLL